VNGTTASNTFLPNSPRQGGSPTTGRYGFTFLDTNPAIAGVETFSTVDEHRCIRIRAGADDLVALSDTLNGMPASSSVVLGLVGVYAVAAFVRRRGRALAAG